MRVSPGFLRFASVCALVTALTTLAIHLLPELWAAADTFEKQLELRRNSLYMARLWVVVVHCLLVVVSMYAVGLWKLGDCPVLAGLGFLGFVVFACAELLRSSLAIFALNRGWRAAYASAADDAARQSLRATIGAFPGISAALFFLFFIAFLAGTLCYGLALVRGEGLERRVGMLLLLWAALSLPTLVDTVAGHEALSAHFGWVGPYFQPFVRAMVGVWLWRLGNVPRPG